MRIIWANTLLIWALTFLFINYNLLHVSLLHLINATMQPKLQFRKQTNMHMLVLKKQSRKTIHVIISIYSMRLLKGKRNKKFLSPISAQMECRTLTNVLKICRHCRF